MGRKVSSGCGGSFVGELVALRLESMLFLSAAPEHATKLKVCLVRLHPRFSVWGKFTNRRKCPDIKCIMVQWYLFNMASPVSGLALCLRLASLPDFSFPLFLALNFDALEELQMKSIIDCGIYINHYKRPTSEFSALYSDKSRACPLRFDSFNTPPDPSILPHETYL